MTVRVPAFFLHATTLLFVALKLTGHIGWSWWYVTLPSWILFAISGACYLIAAIIWLSLSPQEKTRQKAARAAEALADAIGRR